VRTQSTFFIIAQRRDRHRVPIRSLHFLHSDWILVPVVLVAPDAPQTPSMPVYNFTSPFSDSQNFLSDMKSTIVPFSSPLIEYTSLAGGGGFTGQGYVAEVDGIHFKSPGLPNMSLPFMGTEVYWTGIWVEGMEVRHCSYCPVRCASSRNALREGVHLPRRPRRKRYEPELFSCFWSTTIAGSHLLLYRSRSEYTTYTFTRQLPSRRHLCRSPGYWCQHHNRGCES
jgi:hypothetical protein